MHTRLTYGEELGGYRIAELLGIGGMGQVYRAVQMGTGREVAVKLLAGGDTRDAARFENEARIQASLSHAHLAAFFDGIVVRGRRCLVMEYIPGESLADRLRRDGRLAPGEALSVLRQVAAATACMHAAGIVHRDLKPSNVRIGRDGVVKVLDFGIAKGRHTPSLTAAGDVVGTAEYSAPEQLRTGVATPRSDVWAIGILLVEMLTGHVPFRGRFPSQVWNAIERGPTPSLSAVVSDPVEAVRLNAVLARCLSIDPRRRYATAREVEAALSGADVSHPGLFSQIWIPTIAVVLILVMVGIARRGPEARLADAGMTRTAVHRIDVAQGSADVVVNGRAAGRTPFDYSAAPREVVTVELRQPGFQPLVERFDVSARAVWTFSMRPAAQEGR